LLEEATALDKHLNKETRLLLLLFDDNIKPVLKHRVVLIYLRIMTNESVEIFHKRREI
jgi:hypothetical protein